MGKIAHYNVFIIITLITIIAIGMGCEKNNFTENPDDKLIFSEDTIQFDTIFKSIGSTTHFFTVYNSNESKSINIDRIYLAKGNNSSFRLNVNGIQSSSVTNMVIAPGDSAFIFVEVTIDPGRDEMIEQDSVVFLSNGNIQDVDLIAFGQDILLINGQIFSSDTVWTNNKPVLIFNSALFDSNTTLTIEAGTKVHFHKNSSLFIKGSLLVHGAKENHVVFSGDRLEDEYSEISGQWGAYQTDDVGNVTALYGGIHLLQGSANNIIEYAEIKNGIIGIRVDSVTTPGTPSLILRNTSIENMNIAGLYGLGSHIEAYNCVFANCGKYTVVCAIGGNYSFYHCTLANFWSGSRQTPQLLLNNYYNYSSHGSTITEYRDLTNAYFGNCIIYGNREQEISLDLETGAEANFIFENCLLKTSSTFNTSNTSYFIDNILNVNPKFIETVSPYNYELDTLSPAKDAGKLSVSLLIPFDYLGNNRLSDAGPDLGAFERIE
ncbi:MAG TPA: hypothetical protein PLP11_06140 [Bacteroidales bacterium]|nr:hypothetical protein [Bacteroidales bacterium]